MIDRLDDRAVTSVSAPCARAGRPLPRMPRGSLPAPGMTAAPLRVLAVATSVAAPALFVEACAGWAEAIARLGGDETFDVVVADADAAPATPADIAAVAARSALVIVAIEPDAEHALGWLRHGADDVIGRDELAAPPAPCADCVSRSSASAGGCSRPVRLLHRQATGLPHRQQLVEHLSQLLALREREPAPMAVLAFRIEGLATARRRRRGGRGRDAAAKDRRAAARRRARQRRRRRDRRRRASRSCSARS